MKKLTLYMWKGDSLLECARCSQMKAKFVNEYNCLAGLSIVLYMDMQS